MIYIPKGIHLNNFAHGKPNMYCKGPNGDPIATLSVCLLLFKNNIVNDLKNHTHVKKVEHNSKHN